MFAAVHATFDNYVYHTSNQNVGTLLIDKAFKEFKFRFRRADKGETHKLKTRSMLYFPLEKVSWSISTSVDKGTGNGEKGDSQSNSQSQSHSQLQTQDDTIVDLGDYSPVYVDGVWMYASNGWIGLSGGDNRGGMNDPGLS